MAGTKFAYVRNFELPDSALPETYLIVRIDGKGFHKFSKAHDFDKPNDPVALELMNVAAQYVMTQLKGQVSLAFGESDEYSFLLRKQCTLYSRRISKITTHIASLFTSAYVFNWSQLFPQKQLLYPPSFDGRLVMYPNERNVRDYFSWRQADTHINNLYNTTFWAMVLQGNLTELEATKALEGTLSSDKNEILFSRFGINYDQLEAMYRKGTTLVWTADATNADTLSHSIADKEATPPMSDEVIDAVEADKDHTLLNNKKDERLRLKIERKRAAKMEKLHERREKRAQLSTLRTLHCDIIADEFWQPAPTSSSAPLTAQVNDALLRSSPWLDPKRKQCAGLGQYVLDSDS